ncbi:MAG: hypothetical protein AAF541_15070 [Pseudomonadota bacterium]
MQRISEPSATLFLIGCLACYLAPDLVSLSYALDGLVYANIANLLAQGEGSFWYLPYYVTEVVRFVDHPPLGIYIQSLTMAVINTDWWVDKLYTTILIGLFFLGCFHLGRLHPTHQYWPVLLLLSLVPLSTYTLKNGFLEVPLSIAIMGSVWAVMKAYRKLWWALLASALMIGAVMIKGPVGLFPLVAPMVYLVIVTPSKTNIVRATSITSIMGVGLLACLGIGVLSADITSWLQHYLSGQVLDSITGARPAEHGRLYLLYHLFVSLAIITICAALLGGRFSTFNKTTVFWLLLGLAFVIPLLLSARQYRHYLLPALPFFVLAANSLIPALSANSRVSQVLNRMLKLTWWAPITIGLVLAVYHWGKPGDHVDDLDDAQTIASTVQQTTVGFCSPELSLSAYLYRHHNIKTTHSNQAWVVCKHLPGPSFTHRLDLSDGVSLWHKPRTSDHTHNNN